MDLSEPEKYAVAALFTLALHNTEVEVGVDRLGQPLSERSIVWGCPSDDAFDDFLCSDDPFLLEGLQLAAFWGLDSVVAAGLCRRVYASLRIPKKAWSGLLRMPDVPGTPGSPEGVEEFVRLVRRYSCLLDPDLQFVSGSASRLRKHYAAPAADASGDQPDAQQQQQHQEQEHQEQEQQEQQEQQQQQQQQPGAAGEAPGVATAGSGGAPAQEGDPGQAADANAATSVGREGDAPGSPACGGGAPASDPRGSAAQLALPPAASAGCSSSSGAVQAPPGSDAPCAEASAAAAKPPQCGSIGATSCPDPSAAAATRAAQPDPPPVPLIRLTSSPALSHPLSAPEPHPSGSPPESPTQRAPSPHHEQQQQAERQQEQQQQQPPPPQQQPQQQQPGSQAQAVVAEYEGLRDTCDQQPRSAAEGAVNPEATFRPSTAYTHATSHKAILALYELIGACLTSATDALVAPEAELARARLQEARRLRAEEARRQRSVAEALREHQQQLAAQEAAAAAAAAVAAGSQPGSPFPGGLRISPGSPGQGRPQGAIFFDTQGGGGRGGGAGASGGGDSSPVLLVQHAQQQELLRQHQQRREPDRLQQLLVAKHRAAQRERAAKSAGAALSTSTAAHAAEDDDDEPPPPPQQQQQQGAYDGTANVRWYDARARVALKRVAHWLRVPWPQMRAFEQMWAQQALQLDAASRPAFQSSSPALTYLKVGAAALGGGALLALTGGLAAPAVAAGLGAAVTLAHGSAAVATAVSGFAGSTAGTAAITSAFGAWGANAAGSSAGNLYASVKEFGFWDVTQGIYVDENGESVAAPSEAAAAAAASEEEQQEGKEGARSARRDGVAPTPASGDSGAGAGPGGSGGAAPSGGAPPAPAAAKGPGDGRDPPPPPAAPAAQGGGPPSSGSDDESGAPPPPAPPSSAPAAAAAVATRSPAAPPLEPELSFSDLAAPPATLATFTLQDQHFRASDGGGGAAAAASAPAPASDPSARAAAGAATAGDLPSASAGDAEAWGERVLHHRHHRPHSSASLASVTSQDAVVGGGGSQPAADDEGGGRSPADSPRAAAVPSPPVNGSGGSGTWSWFRPRGGGGADAAAASPTSAATAAAPGKEATSPSKPPRLRPLLPIPVNPRHSREGRLALTVGVNGCIRQPDDFVRPWLGLPGKDCERYALVWEATMLKELGGALATFVRNQALQQVAQRSIQTFFYTGLIGALAIPMAINTAINVTLGSKWRVGIRKAQEGGHMLAHLLLQGCHGDRPVTLVACSLGARLVFHCLLELARAGPAGRGIVEDVVLLGTPVSIRAERWVAARSVVGGRFINGYSVNDWTLGVIFKAHSTNTLWNQAAGIWQVGVPGVENVNLSKLVSVHDEYVTRMEEILSIINLHDD